MLAAFNLLNEKDSGGSDAEVQENASDWELSISEKELSTGDEVKNDPDLSATSYITTLPVTAISLRLVQIPA